MILHILIYVLIGFAAGFLSGLLGIGGGVVIVPCLFFIYHLVGGVSQPLLLAVGTSLATMAISSLIAMILYNRRHAIYWAVFKGLNIPLIVSSFLGVLTAYILPEKLLAKIFALIILVFGFYFFLTKKVYKRIKKPEKLLVIFFGILIGFLSCLLGIGGGVVALPFFMMFLRVPNYCLVGSSAVATFITSLVGTLSFILMKLSKANGVTNIEFPACIIMGGASIFSVFVAIKLQDRMDIKILKKIFSVILIVTGIFIFFK